MAKRRPLMQPGYTKVADEYLELGMAVMERDRRGSFLIHLLVLRETVGFVDGNRLGPTEKRRQWTRRLYRKQIAERIGRSLGTARRILDHVIMAGTIEREAVDITLRRPPGQRRMRQQAQSYRYRVANPARVKKQYTMIPNWLIDEAMPVLEWYRPGAFLVLLLVWRRTVGRGEPWVRLSASEIARAIGWDSRTVERILQWYREQTSLLERRRSGRQRYEYRINPRITGAFVEWGAQPTLAPDGYVDAPEPLPEPYLGDFIRVEGKPPTV